MISSYKRSHRRTSAHVRPKKPSATARYTRSSTSHLQAGSDPFRPPETRDEIKRALGDRVTVVLVPEASHALFPEQPRAAADAIVAWVKSLP